MEALNQVWLRLKALAFRRRLDRDLEDELSFHLELREERLRDQGTATPETEARKRFGNRVLVKEVMRDSWTFTALEELLRDSRLAVRSLRRAPAFSCISLLTIGLAAGGLATVFAVVNGVLLRPLPYPESHRLVQISELQSRNGFVSRNVGASQFLDWRSSSDNRSGADSLLRFVAAGSRRPRPRR
jgi:putative ABC transport system permease protein